MHKSGYLCKTRRRPGQRSETGPRPFVAARRVAYSCEPSATAGPPTAMATPSQNTHRPKTSALPKVCAREVIDLPHRAAREVSTACREAIAPAEDEHGVEALHALAEPDREGRDIGHLRP